MSSEPHSHTSPGRSLAASVVFVAMLLAALSLWTAIPLSWIYIGSKVSQTQFPSMGPYLVVAVGIISSILFVAWLIGRLNRLYVQITGTNRLDTDAPDLAEEHARHPPRWPQHDGGRGGPDGLGAARRAGAHRLVLPARRLADPKPIRGDICSPSIAGLDDELAVFLHDARRRPRACRRGAGRRPGRCGRRTR